MNLSALAASALSGAKPAVFWTDSPDAPKPAPSLHGSSRADLVIIGGGFSGLWASILAADRNPSRSVVLLEAEETGFGASSRNGGFVEASLTHGIANGLRQWPNEMRELLRIGDQNYRDLLSFLASNKIDARIEETGVLHVATASWQLDELAEYRESLDRFDIPSERLTADQVQAEVRSPTYVGGLRDPEGTAITDPARLVWGLRQAAEARGVAVHDHSAVVGVESQEAGVVVRTAEGSVAARRVVVATNAYASPVKSMRRYIVPVYDYVLMTEPLSADQLRSIGWEGRQGLSDVTNQFHYYRLTHDNRILWGGYDAIYRYKSAVGPEYDQAGDTHHKLAEHFFTTFPQLEGLSFSHRWAGPIGTTTRFTATWGTSFDGNLAWVGGYTGLGVCASRFGAAVALDLVDGRDTELTNLSMVRKKPMPFPPEPFRYAGIQLTRRALAKADEKEGRRGPWLKLLDKFGVGFDS
ncbi:MAG: FAD-dependent oxidoreductase [Armatimonadetes bacterium]|nr:MAG: FAD-dependent oxidoreductase [Armatimonadota bacterium]